MMSIIWWVPSGQETITDKRNGPATGLLLLRGSIISLVYVHTSLVSVILWCFTLLRSLPVVFYHTICNTLQVAVSRNIVIEQDVDPWFLRSFLGQSCGCCRVQKETPRPFVKWFSCSLPESPPLFKCSHPDTSPIHLTCSRVLPVYYTPWCTFMVSSGKAVMSTRSYPPSVCTFPAHIAIWLPFWTPFDTHTRMMCHTLHIQVCHREIETGFFRSVGPFSPLSVRRIVVLVSILDRGNWGNIKSRQRG